ncbi:maleylpyruvate isomerase family mycothiol-dependent enzyme [Rhodococcus chondri]|uniref:Maleylpyruvate isomerase family mycothiol-dependent enzyme n=1 Tax=Rhodococcus chondri TaxID=3065941 RepID=A0ABU7JWG0_9NOCA|nr:maleylpyruvate isomerase family mycothiol-dependent enzyme [Rhodococcus sp. CC-R104]MEE2033854.1 maleylpyruvate isomerase family mycothiol-dependent enzyme [Rhodococcus sp. CC-R104]
MTSEPESTGNSVEFPVETIRSLLFEEFAVIDGLLSELEGDAWYTPTALPGWTVKDIVSHLIGTESMLAGLDAPHVDLDVHTFGHVRNEIGAFNEHWVESLRGTPGAEVLARFRDIVARRREQLGSMTQEDFEKPADTPVGRATYGRFMRIRVFDCWLHELDIRDALGAPGDEGGPRAELASSEIFGAVPFVVGKLGKAPDGARITIELTGVLARTIHLEVRGRATPVPELSDAATSTITMDSGLFVRLAGGRARAFDHRDEIALAGDTTVGRRIVDNLAFTI